MKLIPFSKALDKDVAMTTGRIDGYFGDLFTPIILKAGGTDIRIVARNFRTGRGRRMFAVMAGSKSGLTDLTQLADVPVAVSTNTIIEYVTYTLMRQGGVPADRISFLETKSIPLRFQMMMAGQVKSATLPEPLVTLAESQGGRVLADDGRAELTSTVLIFGIRLLADRSDDVGRFLAALNKAVELINTAPQQVRPIMNRNCNVPKPLRDTYPVPEFPFLATPERVRVEAAVHWLAGRGVLKTIPSFAQLVDGRFTR